jgi:long-chain acyl-CoA synthetase
MNLRTVYSVLEETTGRYPQLPALHQPLGKGKYRTYSWQEFLDASQEIACGLSQIGVAKGEIVTLFSETRAEFYLADFGIMAMGAIASALYTSNPLPDLVRVIRSSGSKLVFVENAKSMKGIVTAAGAEGLPVQFILLSGEGENAMTLDQLRERGREAMKAHPGLFEELRSRVTLDDHAILYSTSGATGEPKMGMVTHRAVVFNMDHGPQVLPVKEGDRALVFLPSAHIAQRVVLEMVVIRCGVESWFSEGLARMPNELKTVKPTFFLAPPRVWERVFASINTEVKKKSALQQKIFHGAVGLGSEASRLRQQGKPVPGWMASLLKIADKIVFSKIRERLGGELKVAASGAAPLGKELAEFYGAIGLPLIEGYGLTEGGVVTLNPLDRPKFGSIGKPLPGVEVKLAEDNELMVKSPCNFSGYVNDPVATAAVLRDGWLYTGDIAEIDPEGYVYITGRKKELIVSSNGKKIYPSKIEGLFKTDPVINQVVLIGDKLPFVTALITINPANAELLKGMEGLRGKSLEEMSAAAPVFEQVQKTVAKINKQLSSFEQIRKFKILERDFSIESGELTPTMKVRRGKVLENYRATVSELYMGKEESQ